MDSNCTEIGRLTLLRFENHEMVMATIIELIDQPRTDLQCANGTNNNVYRLFYNVRIRITIGCIESELSFIIFAKEIQYIPDRR